MITNQFFAGLVCFLSLLLSQLVRVLENFYSLGLKMSTSNLVQILYKVILNYLIFLQLEE
jgi:hypothetical protein